MNVGMKVNKKVFRLDVSSTNIFCPDNLVSYIESNLKVGVRYILLYKLVSFDTSIFCRGFEVEFVIFPVGNDDGLDLFVSINDDISEGMNLREGISFNAIVMYFVQPECSNQEFINNYMDEFINNALYDINI